MSRSPAKIRRLVRLNQFRETVAGSALRKAISEHLRAKEAHVSAVEHVESLAPWKSKRITSGALDLALYSAVLGVEEVAMRRSRVLEQELACSGRQNDDAKNTWIAAASRTQASENRFNRERMVADTEDEKRSFDQISDIWLNSRGERRD